LKWLEVTVHTPLEGVEAVADIFHETGAGGVVIEDPAFILSCADRTHPEEWGIPPEAMGTGMPRVIGYLPVTDGLDRRLDAVKTSLACLNLSPAPEIDTETVSEADWAGAWWAYYKPVRAGRHLVVKPSWEDYLPGAGDLVIEMDPGMAFGSGTHATTSLCLRLLEKYVRPGQAVYDVGTGSGILAVAAAKLGADRVTAIDLDPVACRVAAENVRKNVASGKIQVVQGNLLDIAEESAGLVVANIIADVIIDLAPDAAGILVSGGIFIASGIIGRRSGEVRSAMEASGLTVVERLEDGQWVAFAAEKTNTRVPEEPNRS